MSVIAITPHHLLTRDDLGKLLTVTRPRVEQSATGQLVGVKYAPEGTYVKLSLCGFEATIHLHPTDELRFQEGR